MNDKMELPIYIFAGAPPTSCKEQNVLRRAATAKRVVIKLSIVVWKNGRSVLLFRYLN